MGAKEGQVRFLVERVLLQVDAGRVDVGDDDPQAFGQGSWPNIARAMDFSLFTTEEFFSPVLPGNFSESRFLRSLQDLPDRFPLRLGPVEKVLIPFGKAEYFFLSFFSRRSQTSFALELQLFFQFFGLLFIFSSADILNLPGYPSMRVVIHVGPFRLNPPFIKGGRGEVLIV